MRTLLLLPFRPARMLAIGALVGLVLALGAPLAWSQSTVRAPLRSQNPMQSALVDFGGAAKTGPLVKVGLDLCLLYEQQRFAQSTRTAMSDMGVSPLLHLVDDKVIVDVTVEGDPAAATGALGAIGMEVTGTAGHMVSGNLPIASIPELAALAVVRAATPAMWTTNVGLVTSQGDASMRSDFVRTNFNVNGTGVTVGVMSDSYNHLGGAAADVTSGDLPGVGNPNGFVTPINVIQDSNNSTDTDEGRGMLQLVHDVAPGAKLAFATANGGQANFATNVGKLRTSAGANVEVDDVIYYGEPMFQDGVIAQACDACNAAGVPYFSSAGNQARNAYTSAFVSGGSYASGAIGSAGGAPSFMGGTAHDFNPGAGVDNFQSITIGAGATMTVALEWDQPFASVSGGAGCQSDVDLYLLNSAATQVVGGSVTGNVGGDAVEVLQFKNTGASATNYNLMIVLRSGPQPGTMKYVMYSAAQNEYQTNSGTVYGHCNANGAQAVAAAPYYNTPVFGVTPPTQEGFSSSGTTPILFTTGGAATFDARAHKPGITAPDGCNTTFFGSDSDGDGFPNFFGTSAAAPNAAAVAALMLQVKSTATPAQIHAAQEASAINMDVAGFDNNTGAGLVQAPASVEAMDPCTVMCPGNIVSANDAGQCGAVVTFAAPTTSGLCGTVTLSKASGSFFPVGTTTVKATSPTGANCSFMVTVNDLEAPKLTCPANVTVECTSHSGTPKTDPQLTAFFAGVSATDNCDPSPVITNDAPANFTACAVTTVTFTAKDSKGNTSTCTADVRVVDTTPPDFAIALDRTVLWPPNHKMVPITVTATATDICDPSPTFVLVSVTSNEPDNGTGDGDTANDIQGVTTGTPDVNFSLRSERSGNLTGRIYTIVYTASDHCGNSTTRTATVTVPHDHSGLAAVGQGFIPDGTALDPAAATFALTIQSVPVVAGDAASTTAGTGSIATTVDGSALAFNARLVDRSRLYVGNGFGVVTPLFTNLADVDGDGNLDLVAVFKAADLRPIMMGSALIDGPIGLHYQTRNGEMYLVPNLFATGRTLSFPEAALQPPASMPVDDAIASAGAKTASAVVTTPPAPAANPAVKVTALTGVYPNPFDQHTTIAFSLAREGAVDVAVYDILGARIRTIRQGAFAAGRYQDDWDGMDDHGRHVGQGVYLVRMTTSTVRQVVKVARMR